MRANLPEQIALCRHYPYDYSSDWVFMSSEKYNQWIDWGEKEKPFIINKRNEKFEICYTSPLPRALETAKQISPENIRILKELREIPFRKFHIPILKLPKIFWQFLSRLFWFLNIKKNTPETIKETKKRAEHAVKKIIGSSGKSKKILIISHGFFLNFIEKELRKMNYTGNMPTTPEYGKLYTYKLKN